MRTRKFAQSPIFFFLLVAAFFGIAFAETAFAEEYPGAFYFGDSGNGDGSIQATDLNNMRNTMIGLAADYSGVVPPDLWHVQDVDGDGVIQSGDINVLKNWIIGNYDNPTGLGIPFALEVLTTTPLVAPGDSVALSVWTYDNPSIGTGETTSRSGWGVIFEIGPGGCQDALLYGRDPTPNLAEPKGKYIMAGSVFEYAGEMESGGSSGGRAEVKLFNASCAAGDTIFVIAHLPDDAEAIPDGSGSLGRFPADLYASPIEVSTGVMKTVTGIAITNPAPIMLLEGDSVRITTVCAYDDFSTDDCTDAGGALSSVTSGGNLSEPRECVVEAADDPCGADPPDGLVAVWPAADPGISDSAAVDVTNDDVLVLVDVTPEGRILGNEGETQAFACLAAWSDSCTEDCTAYSSWFDRNAAPAPCGALGGGEPPNVYTFANGYCEEEGCATVSGLMDCETVAVCCQPPPPALVSVFPLSGQGFDDRFTLNAHVDQNLTVILDPLYLAIAGPPSAVTAKCTSLTDGSSVDFDCDMGGLPGDPDVACAPESLLNDADSYACTAEVTGVSGLESYTGTMSMGLASAAVNGGMGGGYVGGLVYDSATGSPGPGTVTLTALDEHTGSPVAGKVYVQVWQNGGLADEYFTDPLTGSVTMSLDPVPLDEITLAYKCGRERCAKGPGPDNYSDYVVSTWTDVDAGDLVLPMHLLPSAQAGRPKIRIQGTIPENCFSNFIGPQPATVGLGMLLRAPVHLRAAFVMTTPNSGAAISGGLDSILTAPDYQVSISLCILTADDVHVIFPAAIPPNLILPEMIRSDWKHPCASFATNPGKYTFEVQTHTPGVNEVVWSLGTWINAGNFSVSGGLDIFSYPIYACGLGIHPITTPTGPGNMLSGDTVVKIGQNAAFIFDLRENWTNDGLGWDPDMGVDRKVLFAADGRLPIDPARRDAELRSGTYRVTNLTDSELWPPGDDTWDKRFFRANTVFMSGADFGSEGIGVTGLSLFSKIDDPEFTIFNVVFIQSTPPLAGIRNIEPWANSAADSEVVSIQHAGLNSTWWGPGDPVDFTAYENGGHVNYSVISCLSRGSFSDDEESNPASSWANNISMNANPGSVVSIWHIGPPEDSGNETVKVDDFLNLPEAVAPNPDQYIYPASYLAGTTLNSELWRVRTVDIIGDSDDAIPGDGCRFYFEFTRPTMMNASSKTIHTWAVSLGESDIYTGFTGVSNVGMRTRRSAKAKVSAGDGLIVDAATFYSSSARFTAQGVAAGDTLWINSRRYGVYALRRLITDVDGDNTLTIDGDFEYAALYPGYSQIVYRVIRANPQGECLIDQWYGGGPTGYECRKNTFWNASGPVIGAGNIRVNMPELDSGPAVLYGATGFIPDIWDGISPGGRSQLEWTWSVAVFDTSSDPWALGGAFDWNNQDMGVNATAIQHAAMDSAMCFYQ